LSSTKNFSKMRLRRSNEVWMLTVGLAVLACLLLVAGCTRERPHTQAVARVDGSELTIADLAAVCDTTPSGRAQARMYINDWIVRELLYTEAVRRGIADGADVRGQVEQAKKQFAVTALLNNELGLRDTTPLPDAVLRAYFDSSASTFALPEDVVNLSYVLFSERDAANAFRSRVLRGASWEEAVNLTRSDSAARQQLLQVIDHRYVTHASLYPEELWKLARSLGTNAVSFVIRTDNGYYVLHSGGLKHQGEIPDFAFAREMVQNRLLTQHRRARYEEFLRSVRMKHSIELLFDSSRTGAADSSERG